MFRLVLDFRFALNTRGFESFMLLILEYYCLALELSLGSYLSIGCYNNGYNIGIEFY